MSNEPSPEGLSVHDAELIGGLRGKFERQWESLSEPKVDAFLSSQDVEQSGLEEASRTALLTALQEADTRRRQNSATITATGSNTDRPAPDLAPDKSVADTIDATIDLEHSTVPHASGFVPPKPSQRTADGILGRFKDYELLDEIARGGMGIVYKARQVKLNRVVAIKMILTGQLASDDEVRRFYTEAEAAAKLDHIGIVPIHEVGEHGGQHYFSMGYIDGGSLAEHAQGGPLPQREAADLVCQVATAVHYAHEEGIVHRVLKPRNILLQKTSSGSVIPKVTDFGLAAKVEGDHELTATGQVLGTPSYMPPEQAAGRINDVGPHSDVYALGAVLYRLLTGRPPFQLPNVVETIRQILESDPVSPRLLNPGVDRDLETICMKCLEKDSASRYESAAELAAELRRYLEGVPIQARRIGPLARSWRWIKRKPMAAALCAAIAGLVILIPLFVMIAQRAGETRRISELNNQIELGLDDVELSSSYLERMDALVGDLAEHSPELGEESSQRLNDRFVAGIRSEIRRPKLEEEQIEAIRNMIALVESRSPSIVGELREQLRRRQSDFESVFHQMPPFANLRSVFRRSEVKPKDEGKAILAIPDKNVRISTVITSISSEGHVQLEATFGPQWQQHHRLGVAVNHARKQGYEFLLLVEQPADRNEGEEETFQSVRDRDGSFTLSIERNGLPLLRREIHHSKIASGPLTVRGTRERGKLTIQIGSLRANEFRDPFPLGSARIGVFALVWPTGLDVVDVHARRRQTPAQTSALEQGDELYDQGRYSEAMAFYQEQERETEDIEFKQEALYKQGTCLVQLNRIDEAADTFSQLIAASNDRWPPLAGCQLWMLRLRQNRQADADAIYDTLSTRFRFEQLAVLIPDEVRGEILETYRNDFRTISSVLRYNPNLVRNMQRLAAVDRLLSADGKGDVFTQMEVSRAYRMMGDLDSALAVAERLAQGSDNSTVLRHYSRLLRLTGQPDLAKKMITQMFAANPNFYSSRKTEMRAELARAHAALKEWDLCEAVVDDAYRLHRDVERLRPDKLTYFALMKGFLLERRGATAQAKQIWLESFKAMQPALRKYDDAPRTDAVNMLILGSLADALEDEDAQLFFSKLVSSSDGNPVVRMAQGIISREAMADAFRGMWRTPRGRKYAEAFAFETLNMQQRVKIPLVLAAIAYISQNGMQGDVTAQQDQLLFDAAGMVFDNFFLDGTFLPAHAAQLSLTWRGTTNLFGWAGAAPSLPKDFRGHVAYIFAHRYLRLKRVPQATEFFKTAIRDAKPDSLLARIAAADLELLEGDKGRLSVSTSLPEPVEVVVHGEDQEVARMQIMKTGELELPVGQYTLELAKPRDDVRLSKTNIRITAASKQVVDLQWLWQPDLQSVPLPGIVPHPARTAVGGRWQMQFRYPDSTPAAVVWSADGKFVAASSALGSIWIIDAQTMETVRLLAGHTHGVLNMSWSPDGQRLASVSWDRTVRIWDTQTGATMRVMKDHMNAVMDVAWSPDGSQLASCGNDKTIRIWDARGVAVQKLEDTESELGAAHMRAISWSPDGQYIAAASASPNPGGLLRIWSLADGERVQMLETGSDLLQVVAWSPDGQRVAAGGSASTVHIWRTDDWRASTVEPPHPSRIVGLNWNKPGDQLFSASVGWHIKVWDVDDLTNPIHEIGITSLNAMDVSEQGRITATRGDRLLSFATIGEPDVRTIGMGNAEIVALDVSRDGQHTVAGGIDGVLRVLDRHGQVELSRTSEKSRRFFDARCSPDGRHCAYTLQQDGRIYLLGLDNDDESVLQDDAAVHSFALAWNQVGDRLLVGHSKGTARIWNANDGTIEKVLSGHRGSVTQVDWSTSGLLATADDDGLVRVWNEQGAIQQEIPIEPIVRLQDLRFSPDGQSILVINANGKVSIFGVDGLPAAEVARSGGERSAVWSEDGQRFVTIGNNGIVRVRNRSGELLTTLKGHRGRVNAIAFDPATRRFITGGEDMLLRHWEFDKEVPSRLTAVLPGGTAATFNGSGQLLLADKAVDDSLVYTIETAQGGLELLRPSEFHQRYKLAWPPASDSQPAAVQPADPKEDAEKTDADD